MSHALRTISSACRSALGRFGLLGSQRCARDDVPPGSGPRGRLFRKYVLLLIGLVSLVLLVNAGLHFWFSYNENKTAAFRIQQEKAGSAARRIEEFVDEIERQLGWTTAPQWAAGPIEQRRFDYFRLLRQVPAITELIQLDEAAKEQLKVSRLTMDVVGSGKDYSQNPGFSEARQHRVWFSPVYFHKESEPHMTLAMAQTGRNAGVTIAEVNLKLIWDVITGLRIGEHGYAYVVDRDGRLIAHPDISLVLRNTDLSTLPQVAAARAEASGTLTAGPTTIVSTGINGNSVLTAHAAIAPLGWTVFVELPMSEALAPLYGSALRSAALLILALVLAALAALFLARRMTVPIRHLQAGAARIGAGELDRRIDIHTGDELEELAGGFNRMAGDLQKSYADLEKKVEDRTAELKEALEQQIATAEVLKVINSSPGNLIPVFEAIVEKAHTLCDAACGSLQLWDGERFRGVAMRGFSKAMAEGLRQGYIPGPNHPCQRLFQGERIAHCADLATIDDPVTRAGGVALGGIRTILFVALRKDDALLGQIVAARLEVRPFTDKEIALVENFASQAVIAMENARLLDELRQRQQELRVTFDNMVDGVAMFDEALRLAAWNRNFQELLQLPEAFLAERQDFDTYIRYLTDRGEFGETDPEKQIQRLRARIGEHYNFERIRPDGTVIEVRHNPMAGGGIVLIYSDITERKRSEHEIRAARDAAEAAYRDLKAAQASLIQAEKMASLGQLTAGIAHEIKNPLNFVNNFAELSVELLDELKETAAPVSAMLDPHKRADLGETMQMLTGNLEKIAEHGRRADNIVKSMLEHSRGIGGERRAVDLNGLVEEALNLAYHGARAQDQNFNITLERNFAPHLKPIELAPQEMTRVLLNLFGNGFYAARKRAQESGNGSFQPILTVTTREEGEAVEVKVRDNGSGIAPEIRDKLFQPFFTTKPTGEGTGLGLSISYDIVTQQHGGTITVASQPGAFTEFTVRLPRTHPTSVAAS